MSLIDATLNFGTTALTTTIDVISTNVYDAVTAKKLFAGAMHDVRINGSVALSSGTSPTVRARFVGADNAALSTNPEILADTGIHSLAEDGSTALVSTDTVFFTLAPTNQRAPKEFYGMVFTLGGTNPAASAIAAVSVEGGLNMIRTKAATP